jgi:hypothetical protein
MSVSRRGRLVTTSLGSVSSASHAAVWAARRLRESCETPSHGGQLAANPIGATWTAGFEYRTTRLAVCAECQHPNSRPLGVAMITNGWSRGAPGATVAVLVAVAALVVACGDQSADQPPTTTPASTTGTSTETTAVPHNGPTGTTTPSTTRHSFTVGPQPTPPPTVGVGPTLTQAPTPVWTPPTTTVVRPTDSDVLMPPLPAPSTPTLSPAAPGE